MNIADSNDLNVAIQALMQIAFPCNGIHPSDAVAIKRANAIASNPENARKIAQQALTEISKNRNISIQEVTQPRLSLIK